MFGINTVNYGLTKIGLSDVCACLKTAFSSDKAMKWIKRDRFFQIIGDGYIILNIINGIIKNSFSFKAGLIIAASVLLSDEVLNLTYTSSIKLG
jgi:hypothetical protein